MEENELTGAVIGCAMHLHERLGPGLLESAYKECLQYELTKRGLFVEREKAIPLVYDAIKLDCGYRADLLVEKKLIIEIKAVETLTDVHLAQVLTYLRVGNFRLGLLMNFNTQKLKNGIRRVVNGY